MPGKTKVSFAKLSWFYRTKEFGGFTVAITCVPSQAQSPRKTSLSPEPIGLIKQTSTSLQVQVNVLCSAVNIVTEACKPFKNVRIDLLLTD